MTNAYSLIEFDSKIQQLRLIFNVKKIETYIELLIISLKLIVRTYEYIKPVNSK